MVLPVPIPAAVKAQSTQSAQGTTDFQTPRHPLMFLATSDDSVVGFFDVRTANIATWLYWPLGTSVLFCMNNSRRSDCIGNLPSIPERVGQPVEASRCYTVHSMATAAWPSYSNQQRMW